VNNLEIKKAFGEAVREIRISQGKSQEQLAFDSDLDRTYISGVERGIRNISVVNIQKLAEALDISLTHLFDRVERQIKIT
jgi:transcriptional regulator with XRE-family HTH domain